MDVSNYPELKFELSPKTVKKAKRLVRLDDANQLSNERDVQSRETGRTTVDKVLAPVRALTSVVRITRLKLAEESFDMHMSSYTRMTPHELMGGYEPVKNGGIMQFLTVDQAREVVARANNQEGI